MTGTTAFNLNGEPIVTDARPDITVLDLLRDVLRQKGTKEGCAEGDCGACTVLFNPGGAAPDAPPMAVNSCITTVAQIDGGAITTVEGLRQTDGALNAVQQEMAGNGSSQCGFCTPGIAVALSALVMRNTEPDADAIHDGLAGNLCRCTGYRPILDAARAAAARVRQGAPLMAGDACASRLVSAFTDAGGATAHRPDTLHELIRLRRAHPRAVLLAGGTDLALPLAAHETRWPMTILTGFVPDLRRIETADTHWVFGAAVTWQEVLDTVCDDYPSLARLIRRFGSVQIRSMGTIGGNIGNASPIGDGPPALIALGATITVTSLTGGERTMAIEDFFVDYRKTVLRADEVILHVMVPRPAPCEVMRTYKLSKRFDQDISTVCGALWMKMDGGRIADLRLAYGGMAATPRRARHAEAVLRGNVLTVETARQAGQALADDFSPVSDWRGSAGYRSRIARNLVERFTRDIAGETVEIMAEGVAP